jgi:hypothetical protein
LPPPTSTPPGTIDFGGEIIGTPGQAPQPTLEGIASEVGRIERKLEIMRDQPAGGGDSTDVLQLLGQILEFLQGPYLPGGYEITGPCNFDENGNPEPPLESVWGAGIGQLGLISSKLDALAGIIQHHKNLRQPTCSRAPVAGQGVTVLFQEV